MGLLQTTRRTVSFVGAKSRFFWRANTRLKTGQNWTGSTRTCWSNHLTSPRSTLVNPKRTASDMALVFGIKTPASSSLFSEASSGSIFNSGLSGSPPATFASFSGAVESAELDEHSFSFFKHDTVSWVSVKRVVDDLFRVLPARELRWTGFACLWSPV